MSRGERGTTRTYRSREQSIWILLMGLILAGIVVGDAVGPGLSIGLQMSGAAVGLAILGAALRFAMAGVRVHPDGRVDITNPTRTRTVQREAILQFSLRRHRLYPLIGCADLRDGSTVWIWGIQPPNIMTRPRNRSAQRLIEQLNTWLEPGDGTCMA